MPKANEGGVTVKGGWMREDEWEIGEMSCTLINEEVADALDRLRVCLHRAVSPGGRMLSHA